MWLEFVGPALAALGWIILPGMVVGLGLRLRMDSALLLSPIISVSVIALSAQFAPLVGLNWGPLPPLITLVAFALPVWGIRIYNMRRQRDSLPIRKNTHRNSWGRRLTNLHSLTVIALIVAAVQLGYIVIEMLGTPTAFSQTYDAIFHLNAVRWILDTENASGFSLTQMIYADGRSPFYPAAWHAIAALVLTTIGGDDVTLGTNATIFAVFTFVWPAGVLAFIRTWAPGPIVRFSLLPAAILAGVIPEFPLRFADWGVLYPNLLGYALVPGYLAVFGAFLGARRRLQLSMPAILFFGAVGAPGIVIAHPNAAITVMVAAIALTAGYAFSPGPSRRWYIPLLYMGGAASMYVFLAFVWPLLRPGGASANSWPPQMSTAEAFGQALMLSPLDSEPQWPLMIAIAGAILMAIRYRAHSPVFLWGTFVFLWIVAAGWPNSPERTAIVGSWYSDLQRLLGLVGLATAPVGAMGIGYILSRVYRAISSMKLGKGTFGPLFRTIASAMVCLALFVTFIVSANDSPRLEQYKEWAADRYRIEDGANVISKREYELIEQLPSLVEPDSLIYTDLWRGEPLIYGLTGIQTTARHLKGIQPPEAIYLEEHMNELQSNPKVCSSINTLGVDYVVVFFGPTVNNLDDVVTAAPGLTNLSKVKGLTLVAHEGGAYLYRVTGCG